MIPSFPPFEDPLAKQIRRQELKNEIMYLSEKIGISITVIAVAGIVFGLLRGGHWRELAEWLGTAALVIGVTVAAAYLVAKALPPVLGLFFRTLGTVAGIAFRIFIKSWEYLAILALLFSGNPPLMILGAVWALHMWLLRPLLKAIREQRH